MTCRLGILFSVCLWAATSWGSDQAAAFDMDSQFLTPPAGLATIGDSHGDVATSPTGDIYVSVQGGEYNGIQVYGADGHYVRNIPDAPKDLHGFVIAKAPDGESYIYGASLLGERIVQLTLDGRLVLDIPASRIPDQYKAARDKKFVVTLTGIAVGPKGDIYIVDGYGRDYIHRFDRTGQYKSSFGGRGPPWNFKQCHKIAIDPRFKPERLLCADRINHRVVHMDLDGNVIGTLAEGLRWPSALTVRGSELAVAELEGRVTILSLSGDTIAHVGTNESSGEILTNRTPPERWQRNLFYAPHGITYLQNGDLLVTEWNQWGRVVRLKRKVDAGT